MSRVKASDCRRIVMALAALLGAGEPAIAYTPQVGANVSTFGTVRPRVGSSVNLGSCESELSRKNANEVTIAQCDGGPSGPFVQIKLLAQAALEYFAAQSRLRSR
jgi:hypothetical protein